MKIVHIGHHCCIRVVKECLALMQAGHEVHLIGFRKPSAMETFKSFILCSNIDQYKEAIRLHSDADIFHIHNEPNWLIPIAKSVINKPIVFDVHDSMAYRTDELFHQSNSERLAFGMSDGFVFVSDPCAVISQEKNPDITSKPSIILPSYVNRRFYQTRDWAWRGGIVYQGLVSYPKSSSYMQYANYIDLMNQLADLGLPFHIYTTERNKDFETHYNRLISSDTLDYGSLLKNLGHFDWGFIGNTTIYKDWQVSMPNKLFDYIAGGLPIIAMNCKLVEDFVLAHGIGISVKSVQEIKDRWDERAQCQENLFRVRDNFMMENYVDAIEGLYRTVLDKVVD